MTMTFDTWEAMFDWEADNPGAVITEVKMELVATVGARQNPIVLPGAPATVQGGDAVFYFTPN